MEISKECNCFHLIYTSKPTRQLDEHMMINILKDAQRYNQDFGISGFLLFGEHKLIQLIEGNEENVKELYQKIKKDKRHFDIAIQHLGYSKNRCMPFLGMGLCLMRELNNHDYPFFFSKSEAKKFNALIQGEIGEIFEKYLD